MAEDVELSAVEGLIDVAVLELRDGSPRVVDFHQLVGHGFLLWPRVSFRGSLSLVASLDLDRNLCVRRNDDRGLARRKT